MPNQPKTPARTFRLSDETVAALDCAAKSMGDVSSRSDAVRLAIERFANSVRESSTRIDELVANVGDLPEGVTLEAIGAADDAARLDGVMPQGEADRRLVAALAAAYPHIAESVAQKQRAATYAEVIGRLEGFADKPTQFALDHLRSVAPEL